MKKTNPFSDTEFLLRQLGYHEIFIPHIMTEFDNLLIEIDFDAIEQAADSAIIAKDTPAFIIILKDLMKLLENKGYYRPDYPTHLIKLLVNGLNLRKEDIFHVLDNSEITENEKLSEMEFLASCAAITQLGYILVSRLIPGVMAASSGPHVFLVIFVECSLILADFSIDSIREIDALLYEKNGDHYRLKTPVSGLDRETTGLLEQYYPSFHVISGIGLSHNIHNNLGIAYDRAGRYVEAIEELNVALGLDPDYVEVHNNLAVTLDKMEELDEAINHLKEAIKQKPDYTEAHCNLGTIYAKLRRFDEASEELNESIRLNPRYAAARNNLGNIYSEMGRHEEALIEFQEALRLDPEFAEAYHGIGQTYYDLGSLDRASRAFVRAVCLAPAMIECVPEKLSMKVRRGVSMKQLHHSQLL